MIMYDYEKTLKTTLSSKPLGGVTKLYVSQTFILFYFFCTYPLLKMCLLWVAI